MKKLIKVGGVLVLIVVIIGGFVGMLNSFATDEINKDDLGYLKSLGFKYIGFGYDGDFRSSQYKGLSLNVDDNGIFGYMPSGIDYQDQVISPSFIKQSTGTTYYFELFPAILEENDDGVEYRISTVKVIDPSDIPQVDPQIIKICNDFIEQVKPLTEHQYQISLDSVNEVTNPFDALKPESYKVIKKVGDYQQVEYPDTIGKSYLKGNYLVEQDEENSWITYFDQDNKLAITKSQGLGEGSYTLTRGDSSLSQELLFVTPESVFEYLPKEDEQLVKELITKVDMESQVAKEQLGIE